MSLKSLQLGTAFEVLLKTTPILAVRLGVYLAFWVAIVLYLGLVGGIAFLLGQVWAPLGFILFLVALGGTIPIYRLAYKYVFYLLKIAHLAVTAELLVHGRLPEGTGQLSWGKEQVASRFGQVSVAFLVDELVAGVIRAFTNVVFSITSWLPGDSIRGLARIAVRVVEYATNYVDEAVLARAFWRRDENIWLTAEEGVVLYGMVWRPLLMNAIALMLLSYVPFIAVLVLLAAPIGLLLGMLSPTLGGWSIALVIVLALLVKIAIGDSFAMIAMVASYQRETEGLIPDPAMEQRISGISEQFRELRNRAVSAVTNRTDLPARGSAPPGNELPTTRGEPPPV